ncbi:potassium channel family protein [Pseudomonas panipatensis]|uniref:potassium channel family protein n=1 Tax=Pseudomonas panipatensis TaxID=428992 RepID=UPI0035B36B55
MNDLLLRYRFRLLFAGTLLAIVVLGFPQPPRALQYTVVVLLMLTGLNTLRHNRLLLSLALFFGLIELLVQLLHDYASLPAIIDRGLALIAFYLVLVNALFRRVTQERPVTRELLYGFCALYLQLGLAFAFAFAVLELLWPGSFTAGQQAAPRLDSFVYYSLVTLTTVGYGDIQALSPPARLLSAGEAVIGVFFIALAVSRVITLLHDRELGL